MADKKDRESKAGEVVLKDSASPPNSPIVSHSIGFGGFETPAAKDAAKDPAKDPAKDEDEPTAVVDVRNPPKAPAKGNGELGAEDE